MSLQVHAWRATTSPANNATNYISPINGQVFTATILFGSCYVCAAGTFSNWQIVLPSAPASGKSLAFTLVLNGSDTAAVITIANTATVGTYTGAAIALADGDKITFKCVPSGTPTVSSPIVSWSFNGTTAGQSIYGSGGVNGNITTTRTSNLLNRPDISNFQAAGLEVVACAGIISKITGEVSADSGATGSWTYTVSKNGTPQDGTGGTPDTRLIFNNTGVVKSATFSMSVSPGDYFTWTGAPTGTPVAHHLSNGILFTATTAGESHYGGVPALVLSASATQYLATGNGSNTTTPTVEATGQVNIGLVPFKLKDLYVKTQLGVGVGAAVGYAWNVKLGGNTTALTASTLNNATAANDTSGNVTYAAQDLIDLEVVPANTPTVRFPSWATVQVQIGGGKNAGGSGNNGKKGGGGGLNVLNPGGASFIQIGNPGIDVGITS